MFSPEMLQLLYARDVFGNTEGAMTASRAKLQNWLYYNMMMGESAPGSSNCSFKIWDSQRKLYLDYIRSQAE